MTSDTAARRASPFFHQHHDSTPFIWAHRGASALAPENTVRSFLLAAEIGAPGIELDVQLTRDGVPIILHDPWLWSDGDSWQLRSPLAERDGLHPVLVRDLDWSDLAGRLVRHRDGAREPIPRYEEVLESVPAWLWVDTELKAGWGYDPRLVETALGCVARRPDRVLISSFDHIVLKEVADANPEVPLLVICHARLLEPEVLTAAIPAQMMCIDRPFLTAEDVPRWREKGIEVSVGGPEVALDLAEVLTWPVSGIFLDDPRLPRTLRDGG